MILHIDFNSYFATVEQQANPRLRGKPVGVTGGDRMQRTVLGAASVEAKKYGVKTGMQIWEARQLCPQIILVQGDSDKYLEVTKRFIGILKAYSPYLEVFSIDECFLEGTVKIAKEIKKRIKTEIGEYITCSIGISYNKLMAKLAGSLQKPDGLVVIPDEHSAMQILDKIELDEICGIGSRIQARLNKMGIFNFKQLRQVPLEMLLFHFKSYGKFLYDASRGIDHSQIVPFYEKEEVKSVGHRHTINHDTNNPQEIKQILLKLCEMVAMRLRSKNLVAKTIYSTFRVEQIRHLSQQTTISYTNDGLEIFQAAWGIFNCLWNREKIRMIGVSVSNLKPQTPYTLNFFKNEIINQVLDKVNNEFGNFTLQRAVLLNSTSIKRKPNPYLSDRRFKL
ncbi:DNA polymerase IV [Candidatus Daviesbacteria bacterium]|nr:DNA polymerase IV [Candidatus Daviesbacteria bacterium]